MSTKKISLSIESPESVKDTKSFLLWVKNSGMEISAIQKRDAIQEGEAGLGLPENIIDIIVDAGGVIGLFNLLKTWIVEKSKKQIANKKKINIEFSTADNEKIKVEFDNFENADKEYLEALINRMKNE